MLIGRATHQEPLNKQLCDTKNKWNAKMIHN